VHLAGVRGPSAGVGRRASTTLSVNLARKRALRPASERRVGRSGAWAVQHYTSRSAWGTTTHWPVRSASLGAWGSTPRAAVSPAPPARGSGALAY
jgi:hypothetical protein